MKTFTKIYYYSCGAATAALLFTASLAVAQSNSATAQRKSGSVIASDKLAPRDAQSGQASGRQDQFPKASGARTAVPATASLDAHQASDKAPAAAVQPYKDPEDMTTRYRPGNNKTASTSDAPVAQTGSAADAKKHIGNIKWSDRQANNQTNLDAGSKDAAKSATAPLDGASKDAAKSNTVQTGAKNTKRVTKVDSFTVKQ